MRILGYIEHPSLKISVFRMDNRISVKFENERYEQTFKLGTDERFSTMEAIQEWADASMQEAVLRQFQEMHRLNMAAHARAFPTGETSEFEEII